MGILEQSWIVLVLSENDALLRQFARLWDPGPIDS
jgi:hypothetical protein